jgi:diaminopimelate decarboxylase
LLQEGHALSTIDLGGGIGINYSTDDESVELELMKTFCLTVKEALKDFKGRVMMEPGRALVGRCGVLCSQVEYVKYNGYKDFIILNSGMNHLMRPSLYQAFHRILPVVARTEAAEKIYDVVGPICESSDVLGHNRQIHEPREGDWLAIMDAGAYGMSMASFYNRHEFPADIVV